VRWGDSEVMGTGGRLCLGAAVLEVGADLRQLRGAPRGDGRQAQHEGRLVARPAAPRAQPHAHAREQSVARPQAHARERSVGVRRICAPHALHQPENPRFL
jgi:hypothetical protein